MKSPNIVEGVPSSDKEQNKIGQICIHDLIIEFESLYRLRRNNDLPVIISTAVYTVYSA
jgi:hypothetical protein